MPVTSRTIDPSLIAAAVCTLHELNIPVRSPISALSELSLYVVDGCIVARPELLAFYEAGKFSAENMSVVCPTLATSNSTRFKART